MLNEYVKDVLFIGNNPQIYDMKDEFKSLLYITKKDTNIIKWEKYKKYKPSHDNDSIDCDACELATFIYKNVFKFLSPVSRPTKQYSKYNDIYYVRNHKYQLKLNGECYRGDTMTSFKHIYNHYLKNFKDNEDIEKQIDKLAKLYHTIGNMIPVPMFFNSNRAYNQSKFDFWDLTMTKIKEYLDYAKSSENLNDKPLMLLLNDNKKAVDSCKTWLNHFNNWNDFVKSNYLTPFVNKEHDSYQIILFWDKHSFENPCFPNSKNDFKNFLNFLNNAILERNYLIQQELYKNLTDYYTLK